MPRRVEHKRDLFLLDEAADLLDGLGRAVAVIEADQIDLAAVDAALLVDHLEIGGFGLADHAIGGGGPAIGHGLTDLDFRVGDSRGVGGERGPRTRMRERRPKRRPPARIYDAKSCCFLLF